MKEHWEKFGKEFHTFKEELEELLEMLPQSQKIYKKTNQLNKSFKRLQRAANDMDQFITPMKSIKVTSPFLEDPDFPATWKLWKEYLIEQHGIHLRSRAERMSLKRLVEISDKKPKTAIHYLEFAMSRTDRNFYQVNQKDLPGNKGENKNPKIYKPPPKYQQNPNPGKINPKTTNPFHQKTLEEEIKNSQK